MFLKYLKHLFRVQLFAVTTDLVNSLIKVIDVITKIQESLREDRFNIDGVIAVIAIIEF